MKILVVGSGGREHSLILKLKESKIPTEIFVAPGNSGTKKLATNIDIKATDIDGLVDFSYENGMDLVIVTPDDPLVLGLVDALEEKGIKAFGPNKKAARLEGSKAFSKYFMNKYEIPTADYREFSSYEEARVYLEDRSSYPLVIKVDGLALGKGVFICNNKYDALDALEEILIKGTFGQSGNKIIIEDYLEGFEVSVIAFCDGNTMKFLPSAMDYKKIYDGNIGPNTGGMGAVSPNPFFTDDMFNESNEKIFLPTILGLKKENIKYKGVIYFGLMITSDGPYVLEYNCRFGDPETQVILPLLDGDLLEIILAVCAEDLVSTNLSFKKEVGVCVVIASGGYPIKYESNYIIEGLENISEDTIIYHSGTKRNEGDDKYLTSGGRVLGITSFSKTLDTSIKKVYKEVEKISFKDIYYRKDIGGSNASF